MTNTKKIVSIVVKLLIGIISFYIIYHRLSEIPQLKEESLHWLSDPYMYLVLGIILLLMPINWGIESFKWQRITKQIEPVPYQTALKSVFSGICVGNIAPGRAMEFLAKIVFFKIENRPSITILHFINGMFQMLITVLVGVVAISYKFEKTDTSSSFIYIILCGSVLLICFFCWAIMHVSYIQKKLASIKWFKHMDITNSIHFSKKLVFMLISLSIVRYLVFTSQFYLIYNALSPQAFFLETMASIAAYFMLTSLIPMISVIEPAIRAAIALFVFNNSEDNTIVVVLASTSVWVINVVIPSIIGYVIILKQKIEFRSQRAH